MEEREIIGIINQEYDSAKILIDKKKNEMRPYVEMLYDATNKTACIKRIRIMDLVGRCYKNGGNAFMVLTPPLINNQEKHERINYFLDHYAVGNKHFDANEWIGFKWTEIPVLMICYDASNVGCSCCGSESECKNCSESNVNIKLTTINDNVCAKKDPVSYFNKKYKEISKEDFCIRIKESLWSLYSKILHLLTGIECRLLGELDLHYQNANANYSSFLELPDCFKIIEVLSDACNGYKNRYKRNLEDFETEVIESYNKHLKRINDYNTINYDDQDKNSSEKEIEDDDFDLDL